MDVIKQILFLVFLIPFLCFGQKTPYPKDTIYILFDKERHFKKELNHPKLGRNLYFNGIGVFYDYKKKPDTLPLRYLKNYTFIDNVKNIRKMHNNWISRKFKDSKIKPYNGYFNSSFITYLIEVISKKRFVIYPVIWRNEGV